MLASSGVIHGGFCRPAAGDRPAAGLAGQLPPTPPAAQTSPDRPAPRGTCAGGAGRHHACAIDRPPGSRSVPGGVDRRGADQIPFGLGHLRAVRECRPPAVGEPPAPSTAGRSTRAVAGSRGQPDLRCSRRSVPAGSAVGDRDPRTGTAQGTLPAIRYGLPHDRQIQRKPGSTQDRIGGSGRRPGLRVDAGCQRSGWNRPRPAAHHTLRISPRRRPNQGGADGTSIMVGQRKPLLCLQGLISAPSVPRSTARPRQSSRLAAGDRHQVGADTNRTATPTLPPDSCPDLASRPTVSVASSPGPPRP